jgi:hypothetical protein
MNSIKDIPLNPIKEKNLEDGIKNEIEVMPILEKYFNIKLKKTSLYYSMDFISEDGTYYELKSRNNCYNKYETTMVGYNKIAYANKGNKSVYFVFKFTDGIYYYQYDKSKLKDLIIKEGGRCDRGKEEYKTYAFIDIAFLTKIPQVL